ncbi:hypothetical protein V6N13_037495 [Hibiscus sabdariffa]
MEVMLDEKNEALKYERVKCSTRGKFFDVEILQLRFTEVEAEKLPREALKGIFMHTLVGANSSSTPIMEDVLKKALPHDLEAYVDDPPMT